MAVSSAWILSISWFTYCDIYKSLGRCHFPKRKFSWVNICPCSRLGSVLSLIRLYSHHSQSPKGRLTQSHTGPRARRIEFGSPGKFLNRLYLVSVTHHHTKLVLLGTVTWYTEGNNQNPIESTIQRGCPIEERAKARVLTSAAEGCKVEPLTRRNKGQRNASP